MAPRNKKSKTNTDQLGVDSRIQALKDRRKAKQQLRQGQNSDSSDEDSDSSHSVKVTKVITRTPKTNPMKEGGKHQKREVEESQPEIEEAGGKQNKRCKTNNTVPVNVQKQSKADLLVQKKKEKLKKQKVAHTTQTSHTNPPDSPDSAKENGSNYVTAPNITSGQRQTKGTDEDTAETEGNELERLHLQIAQLEQLVQQSVGQNREGPVQNYFTHGPNQPPGSIAASNGQQHQEQLSDLTLESTANQPAISSSSLASNRNDKQLSQQDTSIIHSHVTNTLFPVLKFPSRNETRLIKSNPRLLDNCFRAIGKTKLKEQLELEKDMIRVVRRKLTQKRSYTKKRLGEMVKCKSTYQNTIACLVPKTLLTFCFLSYHTPACWLMKLLW